MATCRNQIGVKNLLLGLTDCNTGRVYPKRQHRLADNELPMMYLSEYENEVLPTGAVLQRRTARQIDMTVERPASIPLGVYQSGEVEIDMEMHSGEVYSGRGSFVGRQMSNGHQVAISISLYEFAEVLPAG